MVKLNPLLVNDDFDLGLDSGPAKPFKPISIPTLTKTEQKEITQRVEDDIREAQARAPYDELVMSEVWNNSSVQGKQEIRDNYAKSPELNDWLALNFPDTTAADAMKNKILYYIDEDIATNKKTISGWGTTFHNMWQSARSGSSQLQTMTMDVLPAIIDIISGGNVDDPESKAKLQDLSVALAELSKDREALAMLNAQCRDDELRAQELQRNDPDGWAWTYITEEPRRAVNFAAEQIPQMGTQIAATALAAKPGAALGGAIAGLPGAAVGGALTAFAANEITSAALTTVGMALEAGDNITSMSEEDLQTLPRYQELIAEGKAPEDARLQLMQETIKEVLVPGAAIGIVSGLFGPEAMMTRTSIVQGLLKGRLAKRVATGAGIGAVSEGLEEGTEQLAQNVAYNEATGDTRPIMEGVIPAATIGSVVGGLMGGGGGIRGSRTTNDKKTDTDVPDTNSSTVGGSNVPGESTAGGVTGQVTNPKYNEAKVKEAQRRTALIRDVSEEADTLVSSSQPIDGTTAEPLLRKLEAAASAGVDTSSFDDILATVQNEINKNPASTFNIIEAFENRIAQQPLPKIKLTIPQAPTASQTTTSLASIGQQLTKTVQQAVDSPDIVTQQPLVEQAVSLLKQLRDISSPEVRTAVDTLASTIINHPRLARFDMEGAWNSITGETDGEVRGTDTEGTRTVGDAGVAASGQPTAVIGGPDQSLVTPSSPSDSGAGGTTESSGIGGTAQPSTGAVTGDNGTGEPVGRQTGDGADSGSDSTTDAAVSEGQGVSNRVTTRSVEQRASDGRFAAVARRLAEPGSSVTDVLIAYGRERFDFYKSEGLSDTDAAREAEQDALIAMTIGNALRGTTMSPDMGLTIDVADMLVDKLYAELGQTRTREQLSSPAYIMARMLRSLSQVTGLSVGATLDRVLFRPTASKSTLGAFITRLTRLAQDAWHGSPYYIGNGFSLSRIGTGEGTQWEGWGIYFSSSRSKALEMYARRLGKDTAFLYKVDVPENDILLERLKPLRDQPEAVKQAIARLITKYEMQEYVNDDMLGAVFYDTLAGTIAQGEHKYASLALLEEGIPGLTYPAIDGSPNFVIWDESRMPIIEGRLDDTQLGDPLIVLNSQRDGASDAPLKMSDFLRGVPNGGVQINISRYADGLTFLHEFEHYYLFTALETLSSMTQEQIANNPAAAQLYQDIMALATYAGVSPDVALDFSAWTVEQHETITTAFEKYFMDGVAPQPALASAFQRIRDIALRVYQQFTDFINKFSVSGNDPLTTDIRQRIYNQTLPADVRAAFDRQLTGYSEPDVPTNAAVTEQATLDSAFSEVLSKYITAGMDPHNAYVAAAEYLRGLMQLNTRNTTQRISDTILNEDDTAIDYTADTVELAETQPDNLVAGAIDEALQDPMDCTSPLAMLGNTPIHVTEQLIARILPPEVRQAIYGDQPGILSDEVSPLTRSDDDADVEYLQDEPTEEELIAELEGLGEAINEAIAESDITESGVETTTDGVVSISEDTTQDVDEDILSSVSTMLCRIIAENEQSLDRGAKQDAERRAKFTDRARAPIWHFGWWANMASNIRRSMTDGGAFFRLWTLKFESNAVGNPDHNLLWMAFSNIANKITGTSRIIMKRAYNPFAIWAYEQATALGIDQETFMKDIGTYRTAMHAIECHYKQRAELEQALQDAYAMAAGPEKAEAVQAAERELAAFEERQAWVPTEDNPNPPDVLLYGGRSLIEAQMEVQDIVSRYGQDLCDEGSELIGNGLRFISRYLMENGQLSATDVSHFDDYLYYCPMLTKEQVSEGATNDITYFTPRQNFHRYGSHSKAIDAHAALLKYAARAARTVGISEFSVYLRQAYLAFQKDAATGRAGTTITKNGGRTYYNGMAMELESVVNGIKYGPGRHTRQAENYAKGVERDTDVVIRVLEQDADGNSVIRAYRVMFDKTDPFYAKVHEAVQNPFKVGEPDIVLKRLARATRLYASFYTRFKPYFPMMNNIRDVVERVTLLPSKTYTDEKGRPVSGSKIARQMIAFVSNPLNFKRLYNFWMSGSSGSAYLDAILNDFKASGVETSTSWNTLLSMAKKNSKKEAEKAGVLSMLTKALGKNATTKAGKAAIKKGYDTYINWTDFFYAAPAMVQFIKMRENNIGMTETVQGVNELMNLGQRGRFSSTWLSAVFPFVNSISQTSSNLLSAVGLNVLTFGGHPNAAQLRRNTFKSWCVLAGSYTIVRSLIPMMAASLGDGDDDEGQLRLDLIPLSQISSNLILGIGGGDYLKVPGGFGLFYLGAMLAYGADRVERGRMDPQDLMANLIFAFGKTLLPNSAPAFAFKEAPTAFIMQAFAPMLAQPLAQLATNRTYTGAQITYDSFDNTVRKSDRFNILTDKTWIDAAKGIYKYTGIDIAPEEIRTFVNGYLGGVLQAGMAFIESDPLYSNPDYKSTREVLGPVWTALGASSLYSAAINLNQAAYYDARNFYDAAIRKAGIGQAMKVGSESGKRQVMAAAGFSPKEIDDYFALYKAQDKLDKINQDTRKQLDSLYGPDMDESAVRRVFREYSVKRGSVQEEVVRGLNYFQPEHRVRFDMTNQEAVAMLRREIPGQAVIPGNVNLYTRPRIRGVQDMMVGQDSDGLWVNYPAIGPNGERWTPEQAWAYYIQTGQHLGKYRSLEAAEQAAQALREDQAALYSD